MRTKGGAIIIGMLHEGEENADKVIKALIENGIKEGQIVAMEKSPKGFQSDKELFQNGLFFRTIENFERRLNETRQHIKSCNDKKELKELKRNERSCSSSVDTLRFLYRLYDFLFKKRVEILPISSFAKEQTARSMKPQTRKRKRIYNFVVHPIRENYWKKQLRGKKPRFVLVGVNHVSAVKKMIPYERVIKIDQSSFVRKTFYRIEHASIRAHYRAIKEWKKAKRRFALPKRH